LRFIFAHGREDSRYRSPTKASIKETFMDTFDKPNNPTGVTATVKSAVNQTSAGAHNAIDKASDAAGPAVESVASGAHRTVDAMAGAASQAAQTVGGKAEQFLNAEAQLVESSRTYVRDNPITTLAIALGVGYVLSRLLSSR
jgi:ElaB/YqjD/DUF883 family membrane-anchored ribosome-binding protein